MRGARSGLRRPFPAGSGFSRVLPLLLLTGLAGCGYMRGESRPRVPDEEARHRAALATLTVHNRTATALRIAYRTASPPIQEVVLGTTNAGARVTMPPVPAGEPLILLARRSDGSEFALPPRSFAIDQQWTWEIPADATFK